MRFLLENDHAIYDQVLPAGTTIGDDTPYPIYDGFAPSAAMAPLDDEAKKLSNETGKNKQNWGRPEENLPIRISGDNHPIIGNTTNRNAQPIIPPPMEHLTHPTDMKPQTHHSSQVSPIVRDMLADEADRIRAENDKRMAEQANAESDARSKANAPHGVTVDNTGANARAPGQGPASKVSTAPGQGNNPRPTTAPKSPTEPSNQVPRDNDKLTPSSETGKFEKPGEKK